MRAPQWLLVCGECEGVGAHAPQGDGWVTPTDCEECSGSGLVESEEATPEQVLEGARLAVANGDARVRPLLAAMETWLGKTKARAA